MALTLNATISPSALCLCAEAQIRLPLPLVALMQMRRWLTAMSIRAGRLPRHCSIGPLDTPGLRALSRELSAATRHDLGLIEAPPRRDAVWHSGVAPWL